MTAETRHRLLWKHSVRRRLLCPLAPQRTPSQSPQPHEMTPNSRAFSGKSQRLARASTCRTQCPRPLKISRGFQPTLTPGAMLSAAQSSQATSHLPASHLMAPYVCLGLNCSSQTRVGDIGDVRARRCRCRSCGTSQSAATLGPSPSFKRNHCCSQAVL